VAVYATYLDFVGVPGQTTGYGLPAASLGQLTQADVEQAITAASATMDEHFAQWNLPLLTYPANFTMRCCHIAAFYVMDGGRGYNPGAGEDVVIKRRYDEAMGWLDKIQRRVLQPYVTQSTMPVTYQESPRLQPAVESRPTRGWGLYGGFVGCGGGRVAGY
jgi:phage gp36-like protein